MMGGPLLLQPPLTGCHLRPKLAELLTRRRAAAAARKLLLGKLGPQPTDDLRRRLGSRRRRRLLLRRRPRLLPRRRHRLLMPRRPRATRRWAAGGVQQGQVQLVHIIPELPALPEPAPSARLCHSAAPTLSL